MILTLIVSPFVIDSHTDLHAHLIINITHILTFIVVFNLIIQVLTLTQSSLSSLSSLFLITLMLIIIIILTVITLSYSSP